MLNKFILYFNKYIYFCHFFYQFSDLFLEKCINLIVGLISYLVIGIYWLIIYFLMWQFFCLIIGIILLILVFIFKINLKDEDLIGYLDFLRQNLIKFFFFLARYFIKIEKKQKNYFFIFFRWMFFITQMYWFFILFCFFVYFCILHSRFLAKMLKNNLIYKFLFCFFGALVVIINAFSFKIYGFFLKERLINYNKYFNKEIWLGFFFKLWNYKLDKRRMYFFFFKIKRRYFFFRYRVFGLLYLYFFWGSWWKYRYLKAKRLLKFIYSFSNLKKRLIFKIRFIILKIRRFFISWFFLR